MTFEEASKKLDAYGQGHVLRYYDELSEEEKGALLLQIEETDFSVLSHAKDLHKGGKRGTFSPLGAMELDEIEKRKDAFYAAGVKAIKEGKSAALLLAGGMGTRLGSDAPKGVYNIGETKDVFIFQRIVENLLEVPSSFLFLFLFFLLFILSFSSSKSFS